MPSNPPIHTHFCGECMSRFQCTRLGCVAPDEAMCDPCWDVMSWPIYDPWGEYEQEEGRGMIAASELGVMP